MIVMDSKKQFKADIIYKVDQGKMSVSDACKLYQFYAIYSWLQILVGPLPTVVLAYGMFTSILRDSEAERTPEPVVAVKDVGVSVVTGVNPLASAVRRI